MATDYLIVFGCFSFFAVIGISVAVYEGAHRRKSAGLMMRLQAGDALVASGKARISWSMWKQGPTVLLARAGKGAYFLVGDSDGERTEIRGVVQDLVPSEAYRDPRDYIGLVTDSGMVFFEPMGLPPTAQGKPRKMYRPDMPKHVLRGIKAARGVELYQLCWNCSSPRPVDEEHCSQPECADLEVLEEELRPISEEPAMARAGCIVGGTGGALAGLLLYGIVWMIARLFNLPQATRDLIDQYWWVPAVALGLVGYLYLFLRMRRESMQRHDQVE